MKLTPRQRQIAALKQRGAKDKEIAQVLGIDESTVKSHYKRVREQCRQLGIDIFAVPLEKLARLAEFAKLARVEYYKLKFGETDGAERTGETNSRHRWQEADEPSCSHQRDEGRGI